jgi:hypothetical protein
MKSICFSLFFSISLSSFGGERIKVCAEGFASYPETCSKAIGDVKSSLVSQCRRLGKMVSSMEFRCEVTGDDGGYAIDWTAYGLAECH